MRASLSLTSTGRTDRVRRRPVSARPLWLLCAAAFVVGLAAASGTAAQPAGQCAKTWLGREPEFEAHLRTARIARSKPIPVGITRPVRLFLDPSEPVASLAWKPLPPGIYGGFFESYRSEIAAYELDKLLGLRMVPPAVERQVKGVTGAAIAWIAPVTMWRDLPKAKRPSGNPWTFQIIRQRMFDNLIGNDDRNQGNLLIDGDGHLCLIDASRAFVQRKDLPFTLERVDAPLWGRMAALTEEHLVAALGAHLSQGQIRGLLGRRDRMREAIDKLVAKKGSRNVFVAGGDGR